MIHRRLFNRGLRIAQCGAVAGLMIGNVACAAEIAPMASKAEQHAKRGLEASKAFPGLASLCDLSAPLRIAGEGGAARAERAERTQAAERPTQRRAPADLPPTQVFDNLYFVGTGAVSAWVVKTSEGLILIDALNTDEEAKTYIDGGLRKLGLDPAQIKYLLISHAHGDHYGGHNYIVDNFHPRIVMSDTDWKELEKPVLQFSNPRWRAPPKRDMTVNDGDKLQLGDTSLTLYVTPGHTPGTITTLIEVKDQGVVHHAALWGGTGFNFGPNQARLQAYADSAARMARLGRERGVDVFLSNHPARDGAAESIAKLALRKKGEPHAFVKGAAALGAFTVLEQCALAQVERVAAMPK